MKSPLVSVILPVFNGDKFIRQTLDCLLAQDYENIEIIVCDDGSSDSTAEIIKSYDNKIIYIYKGNGGCSSAYNFALEKAEGELIAIANYDDLWREDKISKQVKCYQRTGASLIYTDHVYFSKNNFTFENAKKRNNYKIKKLRSENNYLSALINTNFISCASAMISKNSLDNVGFFDESLPHAEDYDMWLRLAVKGHNFHYVDEILTAIRRHPENKSGNYERMLSTKLKIKNKICSQNNISQESQTVWEASILSDYANGLFKARKYSKYRKIIISILKLNPSTLSQKQIKRFFTSFIK
jgi:glycosyltransferase involved in cell wall biosynthesis